MPLPTIPEYSSSIRTPGLIIPDILRGGHPLKKGERVIKYSGGFCVVFPFVTSKKKICGSLLACRNPRRKEKNQENCRRIKVMPTSLFRRI